MNEIGRTHAAPCAGPLSDDDLVELLQVNAGLSPGSSPLLLAVSGGPDSTVLMQAAALWASRAATTVPLVHVATVDHALRPESREEAETVGREAARLNLPHAVLTWERSAAGRASQAAARRARYRLLTAHARRIGTGRIATAHTRDDQAETVLMRLAAGSGLSGLAGMRVETRHGDVAIVRPLLAVSKARLLATCTARDWRFVEDASNADPRFERVRWRSIMPRLAAEGLDADRLWRLAGRVQRADRALDTMVDAAWSRLVERQQGALAVRFADLVREPEEIALRVLVRALRETGTPDGLLRLDRAEAALGALIAAHQAGAPACRTLAGHLLALDRNGTLVIERETPRRRGRPRSAAATPHSLGMRDARA